MRNTYPDCVWSIAVGSCILIVDDNFHFCESLAENLEHFGYRTVVANSRREALARFTNEKVDVVLLDVMLGEEDGIGVLEQLRHISNKVPVIMITGYATINTAVRSMKRGAFDYVQKPIQIDILCKLIDSAAAKANAENDGDSRTATVQPPTIVTRNPKMLALLDGCRKIAGSDLSILIRGENGTGKELLADLIHARSTRCSREMIKMNCAAFPESLLDNELFGHEKGAYTGATSAFKGVFERAHTGTLFLDEIGDMLPSIQAKILRALQSKEIRRIGGTSTIHVDVRFVAATNKDLEALIGRREFREDLYYRLNTGILALPPLRDRTEDIPLLVEHFLTECFGHKTRTVKGVSDEVLARFFAYRWPGNVRELKNAVFYGATMTTCDTIRLCDLPMGINGPSVDGGARSCSSTSIEEAERQLIMRVLYETGHNKVQAARLLNISRNTLYSKLRKYEISV